MNLFLNRSGRTVSYGYCVSLLIDICSDNSLLYSVQVVNFEKCVGKIINVFFLRNVPVVITIFSFYLNLNLRFDYF